jgi:NYN domain
MARQMTAQDPKLHRRVAVIIDAENMPVERIGAALQSARAKGDTVARIAVADWKKPARKNWDGAATEHGLKLVHSFPKNSGQSRSDHVIFVEALDSVHWLGANVVYIVSEDTDFDILIGMLRARNVETHRVTKDQIG